jgi:uncharacterized protein (TIGR03790 family)
MTHKPFSSRMTYAHARARRDWRWLALWLCASFWLPAEAVAGGGPENVLLVVNRKSISSLTIANHYIALRKIPLGNVLTLDWDPKADTTDIDAFRERILVPVMKAVEQRRLTAQIDYIIYSSDFPWGINLDKDVEKYMAGKFPYEVYEEKKPGEESAPPKPQWPNYASKVGSLNGLTYLLQLVLAGNPLLYTDLRANWYMRQDVPEQKDAATVAFQSNLNFGSKGQFLNPNERGRHYVLSMVLGVTVGRGNTLKEVLQYLERGASADGTHPRGTIYYMDNSDLRTTTRHGEFPEAVAQLKALKVNAQILDGVLPQQKRDVQGLMTGIADYDWKASHSAILPGAICDNFTSFGGIMSSGSGQTPLSEFLRYGATASSGTVTEPYALAYKFPSALSQVHYAQGCTVAEAFYQSVNGPYQLLIVGDPLCRPWANIPRVTYSGLAPGKSVSGKISIQPTAAFDGKSTAEHFELFVDDLRTAICGPGGALGFDTALLADGYHELRVVAVEAGMIRSQGRAVIPIATSNHGHAIEASVSPTGSLSPIKPITVTAKSPGSIGIAVMHNSHLVGRIAGESGAVRINPITLGYGPVVLRAVGLGDGNPINYAWAEPIQVTVEQPK